MIPASAANAPVAHTMTATGNAWELGNSIVYVNYPIVVPPGTVLTGFSLKVAKNSDATNTLTAALATSNGISTFSAVSAPWTATNAANAPGSIDLAVTGQTYTVSATEQLAIVFFQSDATPSAIDASGRCEVTIV